MPTLTMLDTALEVDAEGFLQNPEQWNDALAV